MIQFEPLISSVWAWLFAAAIVVILGFQLFWIQKSNLKVTRKAIRIVLNALLSLVFIGYVFQPVWKSTKPEQAILLYSSSSEKSKVRFWKDSLNVIKARDITKYKGEGNPVYLLGSDFSRVELLKIGNKNIQWISEPEPGSISFLEWKGILRHSEKQVLKGRIGTQDSLRISLSQQGEIIAETELLPDSGAFELEFPASVIGRNELDLMVNDSLYGSVNFFVTTPKPIRYSLQFAFPDPEIRFLSQYLLTSGETVSEQIDISKNASILSGSSESDSLQFLIIDPAQLSKKSIQDALEEGASVLVINLNEVGNDISVINETLGTSFKTKRTTSEDRREIEVDLQGEPYEFESVVAQKLLFENALAVQQVGYAKVGVSLLGKTFPIRLAGDSLRYQTIWQKILGAMLPQESAAAHLNQPIFSGMKVEFQVNQQEFREDFVSIESDSVFLQQSLVNPFSKTGSFVSLHSGWVSIGDSLEIYTYSANDWPSLKAAKLRADFLTEHSGKVSLSQVFATERKVSDWIWMGLFLVMLTMIWMEPKT
ncbi:hypothetical protein, partial [Algoriphagus antarcticus]|uniref:Aerotolerance regulator N-terminal domain-containing protein n=1 Tax=Algoriphagus antarcticus TaxID=238540 RepID=A0A3E0DUC1_9BACT